MNALTPSRFLSTKHRRCSKRRWCRRIPFLYCRSLDTDRGHCSGFIPSLVSAAVTFELETSTTSLYILHPRCAELCNSFLPHAPLSDHLILFIAPSKISTKAWMPVVLLLLSLLFHPYLALRPKEITSNRSTGSRSEISKKETEDDGFSLCSKTTAATITVGYISLQLLHMMHGSFTSPPHSTNLVWAINDN